ncbi:MAG: hypothetical protein ACETWB_00325 [Anaerolineae bacterium]
MRQDRVASAAALFLLVVLLTSVFAPYIAPCPCCYVSDSRFARYGNLILSPLSWSLGRR